MVMDILKSLFKAAQKYYEAIDRLNEIMVKVVVEILKGNMKVE
jgi:hypothetical protein